MAGAGGSPTWLIEPLEARHDRQGFVCGKEPLDSYLRTQARQDATRNVAAPFILVPDAGSSIIIGYYTLSSFGITLDDLPPEVAQRLPRYPNVPATLLGRLAVSEQYRRQGFGEILLMDALRRAYGQAKQIAAAAVVVDAIDEDARRFYMHFDFIPLPERRERLFLAMATIRKLFQ